VSPARDGRRRSRSGQACGAAEAAEAGTLSDHHVVHQLGSLAVFLVLVIAMFPLARGLRRNGDPQTGWSRIRWAVTGTPVGRSR
jgi:hypothetical protein